MAITLRRIAQALQRLGPSERRLLLRAGVIVVTVRALLWLLPWRLVRRFAAPRARAGAPRFAAERLAWAVQAASRVVPRATCLTQSVALARLLAREGYAPALQIGVRTDPRFEAHAWVECDGAPLLTTAHEIASYARLANWVDPRSSPPG